MQPRELPHFLQSKSLGYCPIQIVEIAKTDSRDRIGGYILTCSKFQKDLVRFLFGI